jgi:hypothetical protein
MSLETDPVHLKPAARLIDTPLERPLAANAVTIKPFPIRAQDALQPRYCYASSDLLERPLAANAVTIKPFPIRARDALQPPN